MSSTDEFSQFELTLCADPSWRMCSQVASSRSGSVSGTRGVQGYDFTLWDLPSLYTCANFPIDFNVMLVLTVFGQSQSSVMMTIGCEWISWIHGVQWAPIQTNRWEGPFTRWPLVSQLMRHNQRDILAIVLTGWYVVGMWRENVCLEETQVHLTTWWTDVKSKEGWHQTWAPILNLNTGVNVEEMLFKDQQNVKSSQI